MNRIKAILAITAIGCLLLSCSSGNEQAAEEKGKIGQMTDAAATKITKSIQDPLDQAQKASELANQQNEATEQQLKKEE